MNPFNPRLIDAGEVFSLASIELKHPVIPNKLVLLHLPVPNAQSCRTDGHVKPFDHPAKVLFHLLALRHILLG